MQFRQKNRVAALSLWILALHSLAILSGEDSKTAIRAPRFQVNLVTFAMEGKDEESTVVSIKIRVSRNVASKSRERKLPESISTNFWEETGERRLLGSVPAKSEFDPNGFEYFEAELGVGDFELKRAQKMKFRVTFFSETDIEPKLSSFSKAKVGLSISALGKVAVVDDVVDVKLVRL
jgi:hypothetical protein